jgi:hypothetical protein
MCGARRRRIAGIAKRTKTEGGSEMRTRALFAAGVVVLSVAGAVAPIATADKPTKQVFTFTDFT